MMTNQSPTAHTTAAERRRRMLITALGADIASAMRDSQVIEIMVNPDGALRLDRLGEGRSDTEVRIAAEQVERIIRLVASHARAEVHADHPIISAELPPHIEGRAGERFEGVLPPVSSAPCFSIRKPAQKLHTLDDYVADALMSESQADALRAAVTQRYNRLVSLNSSMQTNICTARMKKATITSAQANSSTMIVRKLSKKVVNPTISLACSSSGQAAEKPVLARCPGLRRSSAESVPPPAVNPACANERKMMSASVEKLFRMNAKAPT